MGRYRVDIPYRSPIAAFAPWKDHAFALLLHGCGGHADARFSYVLPPPVEVFTPAPGEAGAAFLGRLQAAVQGEAKLETGAPFAGGLAGLFSYEFAAALEPAAPGADRAGALPLALIGRYTQGAVFDHETGRAFVSAESAAEAEALAAQLGHQDPDGFPGAGAVEAIDGARFYQAAVTRLRARIRAGDVFQANISRRFAGALAPGDHPYAMFARLCAESPAPFCAFMRLPEGAIVSNSPERLASLRPEADGHRVLTAPIKGTHRRGATPDADAAAAAALKASEKDRAENLMIVDLMRNDLSRVCQVGSVRVPHLFEVQSFANVHHLVSTIEGRLAPGRDAFDLLGAVFPAGSITGAPKIKAMELIRTLEGAPRGPSYGSLVWFGADGAMDASVLIRTALCTPRPGGGWSVAFRVGGGITIDSDPELETLESEIKARSLVRAITGGG